MTRAVLAVCLVMLPATGSAAQVDGAIPAATVEAIDRWTGHVMSHVPGEADTAVRAVWSLTMEDRQTMHAGMALFLAAAMSGNQIKTRSPRK